MLEYIIYGIIAVCFGTLFGIERRTKSHQLLPVHDWLTVCLIFGVIVVAILGLFGDWFVPCIIGFLIGEGIGFAIRWNDGLMMVEVSNEDLTSSQIIPIVYYYDDDDVLCEQHQTLKDSFATLFGLRSLLDWGSFDPGDHTSDLDEQFKVRTRNYTSISNGVYGLWNVKVTVLNSMRFTTEKRNAWKFGTRKVKNADGSTSREPRYLLTDVIQTKRHITVSYTVTDDPLSFQVHRDVWRTATRESAELRSIVIRQKAEISSNLYKSATDIVKSIMEVSLDGNSDTEQKVTDLINREIESRGVTDDLTEP